VNDLGFRLRDHRWEADVAKKAKKASRAKKAMKSRPTPRKGIHKTTISKPKPRPHLRLKK
jgi:hypothetical protein